MSLNKKILALAIVGALPGAANAVINLQGGSTPAAYADEISVPAAITNFDTNYDSDVTTLVGFGVNVGDVRYMRFDYADTTLATALTSASLAVGTVTAANITLISGGGVGSNFAIFQVAPTAAAEVVSPGQSAVLQGPSSINALTKGSHVITYRLYADAASAAINNTPNALSTASAVWYKFERGLDLRCDTGASVQKINVSDPNHFIPGPLTNLKTELFGFLADVDPDGLNVRRRDSAFANIADFFPAGTTLKITGDFSFLNTMVLNGVNAALLPGSGTWTMPALPVQEYFGHIATITTLGATPMVPGSYSGLLTQGAAGPWTIVIPPQDLGVCGKLAFNGSSDRVDFGLTPNATNKQLMRISNPSKDSGPVQVSVWNDAGVKVDFPLSSVKVGPAPGVNLPLTLNAQSSTPMIDINAFYAAAQSVNAGFTVGAGADGKPGKLRIEVRGGFGDDELENSVPAAGSIFDGRATTGRLKSGIYIQAVTSGPFTQSH